MKNNFMCRVQIDGSVLQARIAMHDRKSLRGLFSFDETHPEAMLTPERATRITVTGDNEKSKRRHSHLSYIEAFPSRASTHEKKKRKKRHRQTGHTI